MKTKLLGCCKRCHRLRWRMREGHWTTGPGVGEFGYFCKQCWDTRPKNWEDIIGMSFGHFEPGATFVRYVGKPYADVHGNAFGSILAEYTDGSKLGVNCRCGGSMWLCLDCARKCLQKKEKTNAAIAKAKGAPQ